MDSFDSIIKSFDSITSNASNWSRDSVVVALSLSKAMLNFEFIVTLHVVEQYMSFTESLTTLLQARALDILKAVQHIATLTQVLADAHSDVDSQFHTLFASASKCARKYDVAIGTPRRCSRQTARENHPGDTTKEYFRRSLAIPFLDHLKAEIETRFSSHSVTAMRCLGIIPTCFNASDKADDEELLDFFRSDINFVSAALAELQLWRAHFRDQEDTALPDTPQASLSHASPLLFPNVRKMLMHIMVLPVTSREAERSFSTLRRIKTYLRSTMNQDRLNGLALLNVYNSTMYIPSLLEVRTEFLKKNRRIMYIEKL